jgi:rubrerythrin
METPLDTLATALRRIRDHADAVLKKIESPAERRSLAWKCRNCGYIKHFSKPAIAEVSAPCPRCRGDAFEASDGIG